jgi:Icc-related predicted phosphoesterase
MPRFLRNNRKAEQPPGDASTLYYASDLHGAVRCWRKFLGAGKFYQADALVMGGDLAGKAIVPIELAGDGQFSAEFLDQRYRGNQRSELDELESAVRYNGFYPYAAEASELERYRRNAAAREELFERLMVEEARRWMQLADERIAENGIPVYVVAGNDDPWALDEVLGSAERVISAEAEVVRVGEHEMISCSFANPTPWKSPRELSEDDLYTRLKGLADTLTAPERAIFNLHVPPYDTGLDKAALVNDDLTYVTHGGEPVEGPVGSHAVRQIIEEYQPVLALHGHIHESRGVTRLGRTLCINPGSEYNSGRIHGVLVTLRDDEATRHQFVVG